VLDHELQRLALDREARVAQVGHGRPWRGLRRRLDRSLVVAAGAADRPVGRAAYLGTGLLDVDADHPGQFA
jgi:hypothetical protein